MPCDCSHLEPTQREKESVVVREFLREIEGKQFDHDSPGDNQGCYGNVGELDNDMRSLCQWCKDNDVSTKSLELQLWWKRHQAHDKKKEDAERERLDKLNTIAKAYGKLTDEERKAIGLKSPSELS